MDKEMQTLRIVELFSLKYGSQRAQSFLSCYNVLKQCKTVIITESLTVLISK